MNSGRPPCAPQPAGASGVVVLALLACCLGLPSLANAAMPIEAWREQAAQTRVLAENDVPRAYDKALQLQASLPPEALPADRVKALNLLARTETYLARTQEAERHARFALQQATLHEDRIGQAEAELNIVITSVYQGKIEAMLAAAKHSVELLRGVDRPDLLGEALLRMSMMYRRYDMFAESIAMSMQAMEIARSSNNPLVLAYAHQGMAVSYRYGRQYKEAAEQYLQMSVQARAAHSKLLESEALVGLSTELAAQGDLRGAEARAREALALSRSAGAPFIEGNSLFPLADYLRRQGRHSEAQPLLDAMLDSYERHGNILGTWYVLGARSVNHQSQGRMSAARADAERARALARTLGLPYYLSESTRRAAALAAAAGDPARAYALELEANALAAKAASEKIGTHVLELAQRYKSESKQREIDALIRRNRQQTDEIRLRTLQQRWLWTVFGGSIAVLAGVGYFMLRLRRSQKQIHALNAGLELRLRERTAALRQRTRYMRTLFDMLPLWVWLKDTEGRYLSANQPSAEACGRTVDAMIGKADRELWPSARAAQLRADELEVMATREHKIVEREELLPGAGQAVWMQIYNAPVFDEDGTVLGTVGMARDIGDIRQQLRLGASRARIFERLSQGGEIDEVLSLVATYVETASPALRCAITLGGGDASLPVPPADPAPHCSEPILDAAGQVLGHIAIHHDQLAQLTEPDRELIRQAGSLAAIAIERKRIEEQLQHQAAYDALTGLPNRRMFSDRLREEVAKAGRGGGAVTVLFIDLDRFKEVNDTLGYHQGDRLLVEVAHRIRRCVRESDSVARLGGDEFVIILPDTADGTHLTRLAQSLLDAVCLPVHLAEHTAYVSASIGIASYPSDACSMEQLVIYADRAMYAAKEDGRNNYRFFTLPMHQQAQSRLLVANELRHARAKGQLQVWLQPIVSSTTGQALKAEALMRWRHPQQGWIPPDVFIPIAEETGIILEIGDWIFREAALTAKRWLNLRQAAGLHGLPQVSVNVSPRQFLHAHMIEGWIRFLAEIDLPAQCLIIEITEGLLLSDHAGTVDKLALLRQAGIQLALDDFGTGYSAMAYLKRFNIDYLKIDRSFVRDLETDPNDKAIAEAIVVMARKLGLVTIAEGVETAAQRDVLASVGCDFIQGYLYAKPMPAADFLAHVQPARPPLGEALPSGAKHEGATHV